MAATFHAKGSGGQTTSAASFSITCTISAGDSVVVFGSWDSASTTTPTVATTGGTGSDAFTLVYGPFTSGVWKYGAWLLQSAGTGRTGATVSWASSNPAFADGGCESFSGLTNATLDQVAFGTGTATAVTSGNTPTLTSSDEFAVGFAACFTQINAAGAPWTDDGVITATLSWIEHRILAATTAIQTTFTAPGSQTWISFALTFKAGATSAPFFTTDWGQRGAVKDVAGGPPQRVNRNINLFPNPIPFKQTEWGKQRFLQPQPPDATQPTNINLFKNPAPLVFNDPRYRRWVPRHLPDRIQHLNLPLITAVTPDPFRQLDWSSPRDLLPSYTRAPDQPYNNSLYTVAVAVSPFYQTNWPIPKAPQPSVPLVQQNTLVNLLAQPFAQYDWASNKFIRPDGPDGLQQTNINLFTNPIPFSQTDWSKTTFQAPRAPDQQAYNLSLYTVTVVAVPFSQTDWPTVRKTLPAPPQALPYNTALYTVQVAQAPFSQTDWSTTKFPSPRVPDASTSTSVNLLPDSTQFMLVDWSGSGFTLKGRAPDPQAYNLSLYTVVAAAAPFYQTDWSTTRFQTSRAPDQQSYNLALYTVTVQPFAQYSWPQAIAPTKTVSQNYLNIALLNPAVTNPFIPVDFSRQFVPIFPTLANSSVQSVNTNLFTNPAPLNQIDWSKPYRIVPIASDQNNLPNLLLIQPSVPGTPLGIFQWVNLWKYTVLYPNTPVLLPNLTLVLPPGPPVVPVTPPYGRNHKGGGGKYRGWRPLKKKKPNCLEEIEELEELLRAAEAAAPKPLAPYKPIVYHGPLSAIFAEPIEPRTVPQVRAVISRAKAQCMDDDDEEAILMLIG
jgi:hypothetical protein